MNAFSPRRNHRLFLALVCLFLAGGTPADQTTPIPPFEAGYTVYRAGIPVGTAGLQLEYEAPARYRMRSTIQLNELAALIALESQSEEVEGEIIGGIPRPLRYRAERAGSKAREVSADFNWDSGEVTTVVNGKESSLMLRPRAVDPLSLYLLTMLDLRGGALADEYEVVDRGRIRTYSTGSHGQTTVRTPIGDLETLAVSRQRPNSSKATTFWHAPELEFLPVQVSKTKDGEEKSRLTIDRLTR